MAKVRLDLLIDPVVKTLMVGYCKDIDCSMSEYVEALVRSDLGADEATDNENVGLGKLEDIANSLDNIEEVLWKICDRVEKM